MKTTLSIMGSMTYDLHGFNAVFVNWGKRYGFKVEPASVLAHKNGCAPLILPDGTTNLPVVFATLGIFHTLKMLWKFPSMN